MEKCWYKRFAVVCALFLIYFCTESKSSNSSCQPLPALSYGRMSCSDQFQHNSTCSFQCYIGFDLIGEENIHCQSNSSKWSMPIPKCVFHQYTEVTCPALRKLSFGRTVCTNSHKSGSICYFYCNKGYTLKGSRNSICRNGKWSNEKPLCSFLLPTEPPVMCSLVDSIVNGEVTCSNFNYAGSVCQYSCFLGYQLVGDQRKICLFNGWTSGSPSCVRTMEISGRTGTCAPITAPKHSNLLCTDSNNFLSECTFSCEHGYQLIGEGQTRCLHAGWTTNLPFCNRLIAIQGRMSPCPSIAVEASTTFTCTDSFESGSVCTFACAPRYLLRGQVLLTCSAGMWDYPKPTCVPTFPRGRTGGCPPISVSNLITSCTDGTNIGSTCTLSCNSGYVLTGPAVAVCFTYGSTIQWNVVMPSCSSLGGGGNCAGIPTLSHMTFTCTAATNHGSTCTFQCSAGSSLSGSATTTCLTTYSSWSSAFPSCEIQSLCPQITNPVNSFTSCTNANNPFSICTFTCNAGYTLSGSSTTTCTSSGTWSNVSPICQGQCPQLNYPVNGQMSCTNINYASSVCTFTCDAGYVISGSTTTTCTASQTWSNPSPVCQEMCPQLINPANSQGSCTNGNYVNSVCTFTCNAGYTLSGSSSTTCTVSGTWSNTEPSCQGQCTQLFNPQNGQVSCTNGNDANSFCTFTCNAGYTLSGSTTTTCTASATWSDPSPVCQGQCTQLINPQNGQMSCTNGNDANSVCTFTCDAGYVISGSSTTTCTASATWSDPSPVCQGQCPQLDFPENGQMSCTNINYPFSVCTFTCDAGYVISGSSTTTCTASATWSDPSPVCQVEVVTPVCQEPDVPENGKVECIDDLIKDSVCTFLCNEGYNMIGEDRVTCQSSGEWSPVPPTCESAVVATCLELSLGDKLSITCTDSYNVGSVCTFRCSAGYDLNGPAATTCTNTESEWSHVIPSCVPKACPQIPLIEESSFTCSDTTRVGSSCEFQCGEGYVISGESTVVCLQSSTWSPGFPTCEIVTDCPEVPTIEQMTFTCTDTNRVASSCEFQCGVGFVIFGEPTVICTENSTWSHEFPICEIADCPEVPTIEQMTFTCTDSNKVTSSCEFQCGEFYVISGESTLICTDGGTWNHEFPTCVEQSGCPQVPDTDQLTFTCIDGTNVGSQCLFQCGDGYSLSDESSITCLDTNEWDKAFPTCEKTVPTQCPEVPTREGMTFECTDNLNVQSSCIFQCGDGYSLNDKSPITCLDSFEWDKPFPTCEKEDNIGCNPEMSKLFDEGLSCTNANKIGSVCTLQCDGDKSETFTCNAAENEDQAEWSHADKCESGGSKKQLCEAALFNVLVLMDGSFSEDQYADALKLVEKVVLVFGDALSEKKFRFSFSFSGATTESCGSESKVTVFQPLINYQRKPAREIVKDLKTLTKPSACAHYTDALGMGSRFLTDKTQVLAIPVILHISSGSLKSSIPDAMTVHGTDVRILSVGGGDSTHDDLIEFSGNANRAFYLKPPKKFMDLYIVVADTLRSIDCPGTKCPKTFADFPNGKHSCLYLRGAGMACKFECDEGYRLKGARTLRCLDRNGAEEWTFPPPTCGVATCYEIEDFRFGSVNCTDGLNPGSECVFQCTEHYFREGAASVTCTGGKWSDGIPTCSTDLLCQPPLKKPENGYFDCPDGNQFNAICEFGCEEGFLLTADKLAKCSTPLKKGGAEWAEPPPRCIKCPLKPCAIDLLIVIDSTEQLDQIKFDNAVLMVAKLLKRLRGTVDQGITFIGMVKVNGKPTLDCMTSFVEEELSVDLDLGSYDHKKILKALSNATLRFGCSTEEQTVLRGTKYMNTVGRGKGQASGMMLVITNANAEAPKFTLASVETELKGTKVIVVSMATIGEEKVEMKTLDRTGRFVKNDKLIDPKTPFEELLKSITSSAQRTANLKTSHLLIAISLVVHLLCR